MKPLYNEFDLDAYEHLSWGIGFCDENDPEEINPLQLLAQSEGMSDEEIEEAQMFPRTCGDWSAWLDFDRKGDWVGFHVVVNSDSGGFIETGQKGVMPLEQARKELPGLIDTFHDQASDRLSFLGEWFTREEIEDNEKTIKRWKQVVKERLA